MKSIYSNWKSNESEDDFDDQNNNEQVTDYPFRRNSVTDSKKEELLSRIRHSVVGNSFFLTPFQRRQKITYCDRQSLYLSIIETWMNKHVKPYFTGGALETRGGLHTRMLTEEARQFLLNYCSCDVHNDVLLFCRNGRDGAVKKLLHVLNINPLKSRNRRTSKGGHQYVVFLGPHDPLSTLLAFQRKGFFVIQIPENRYGMADLNILEKHLQHHSKTTTNLRGEEERKNSEPLRIRSEPPKKKVLIGCFSTCSHINGMVMNDISIAQLLQKYGAISVFDYTVGASVTRIEMNSVISDDEVVSKDVIFFDTSNFIGGGGSGGSGILIVNKKLLSSTKPYYPSKSSIHFFKDPPRIRPRTDPTDSMIQFPSLFDGKSRSTLKQHKSLTSGLEEEDGNERTVSTKFLELNGFLNSNHSIYNSDPFSLYEGDPHLGDIRSFLCFRLKVGIGEDWIWQASNRWSQVIRKRLSATKNIVILGGDFGTHVTLISFMIRYNEKYYLHHRFIITLLNDLFGIQCGFVDRGITKYQYLEILGTELETFRKLNEFLNRKIRYEKEFGSGEVQGMQGYSILRPGWVTLTLNPYMAGPTFEFVSRAIEFVAKEGWKFMVEYRVDDEGEFLHKGSNQRTGWKMLRDFENVIKRAANPRGFEVDLNDSFDDDADHLNEDLFDDDDDEFQEFMSENVGSYEEQVILKGIGGKKRFSVHNIGGGGRNFPQRPQLRRGRRKKKNRQAQQPQPQQQQQQQQRRRRRRRGNLSDEELWRMYEKTLHFADQCRKDIEERIMGREEDEEEEDSRMMELEYESEIVGQEVEMYRWFVMPRECYERMRKFDPIGFYSDHHEDEKRRRFKQQGEAQEEEEDEGEIEDKRRISSNSICWIQPKKYETARNSPLSTFHPPTVDTSSPEMKTSMPVEPIISSFPKKRKSIHQKRMKKKKYYHQYKRRAPPKKRKSVVTNLKRNSYKRKSVDESQNDAMRRRSVMEMQIKRSDDEKIHQNKYFNFKRKSKVVIPSGITLHIEDGNSHNTTTSTTKGSGEAVIVDGTGNSIVFKDDDDDEGEPKQQHVVMIPDEKNSRVVMNDESMQLMIHNEEQQQQLQRQQQHHHYKTPQSYKRGRQNYSFGRGGRRRRNRGRIYLNRKANSEKVYRRKKTKQLIQRTKNINVSGFYTRRGSNHPTLGNSGSGLHNKVQKRYIPSLYTMGKKLNGVGAGRRRRRGVINYVRRLDF